MRLSEIDYFLSTHMHNCSLHNPSVKIIDLVSHTTYVVRIKFIHKRRELQFKVDSEQQIFFLRLFMAILFDFQSFDEIIAFVFWFYVWPEAQTLTLSLISQNTAY